MYYSTCTIVHIYRYSLFDNLWILRQFQHKENHVSTFSFFLFHIDFFGKIWRLFFFKMRFWAKLVLELLKMGFLRLFRSWSWFISIFERVLTFSNFEFFMHFSCWNLSFCASFTQHDFCWKFWRISEPLSKMLWKKFFHKVLWKFSSPIPFLKNNNRRILHF